jgi:transcriptional regulator with XRE-family HTH domain
MSVFSNNLKAFRSKTGLKQSEIAELVGITASTWSNYEIAKTEPDIDTIVKIAKAMDLTVDALLTRDVSLIAESLIKKMRENASPNASPYASLMAQSKVNEPELSSPSRIPKLVTVDAQGNENVVFVPVRARAGYLSGYEDPEFIQTLPTYSMPGMRNGTFRAFETYGHSMVPTFQESDVIFGRYVANFNEIRDDRVYVVVTKRDGVVVKRVINRISIEGKLILNSDNQRHLGEYPPIIVDPEEILEMWYGFSFYSRQMRSPKDIYNRMNDIESRLTFLETNDKKLGK